MVLIPSLKISREDIASHVITFPKKSFCGIHEHWRNTCWHHQGSQLRTAKDDPQTKSMSYMEKHQYNLIVSRVIKQRKNNSNPRWKLSFVSLFSVHMPKLNDKKTINIHKKIINLNDPVIYKPLLSLIEASFSLY